MDQEIYAKQLQFPETIADNYCIEQARSSPIHCVVFLNSCRLLYGSMIKWANDLRHSFNSTIDQMNE